MMRLKRLNKKGFTMVELLAVIVILGILAIISVAAVQGIIAKAKERYYKSQEESFVMAAQSYLNNNKKKQPKVSGQTVKVYLKDLKGAKYIDSIVDYKKQECNIDESYVKVFKYEDDVFYTPYITCPNYTTNLKVYTSDIEISATFTGDDKNLNKAGTTIKIVDKNAKDGDGVEDSSIPHGIVSYQYKIYQEGKLKYTSDVFNEKKLTEVTKTVSLVNYTPGMIKVAVTATNIYGNSLTKTFTKSYRDETPPTCGAITGDSTTWKTGTRVVSVACDDGHGAGCKQNVFTYEFTGDVEVGKIKIEDNSGNSVNCPVNVYIDNNPPVLELNVYKKKAGAEEKADNNIVNTIKTSNKNQTVELTVNKDSVNGWLNAEKYPNGVYLEVNYSDISSTSSIEWKWNDAQVKKNASALKSIKKITPTTKKGNTKSSLVDEGYRQGQVIATDQFGHTSVINVNIPMDRTPPTYTKSGDSTTWTKDDRTVTVNCVDLMSECESSPGTEVYNTTIKTQKYTLKDNAGNTSSFNANIYVDKTAPSCNKITGASTEWTGGNRTVKVSCSDNHSGCSQDEFSKVFDGSTKVGKITISDKVGNTKDCDVNAYVDKTPPTCGMVSGQSTTWTNKDRNISVACSDSQSGCTKTSFSHNFTTTQQNGNITIKDNVGNQTQCPVTVNVDKNAPSCGTVTGQSTAWTRSDRNISVACNDTGGSGCSAVSKNFNTTTKTSTIKLKDGAGNTTSCNVNAYVDKTAPSCGSISGASTTWTKNDRSISVACSDSDSGCGKSSYTTNFNWSIKTGTITITDNVGNTRDCSVNAYVDKTAPSCGSVSGASTTWTKNNRDITVACSDGHSGCAASSYKKTFSSTTKTGTITLRDNAGNTKDCSVNAYVDKNAPTCGSISGASTSWTNGNRNITVNCNDTGSGCSAVQKNYTSTKRTDSVQIKDAAGNTASCSVNVYVDKTAPSCNGVWGDSTSWTNGDRNVSVGCSDSDSGCQQGSYSKYYNWTIRSDGNIIRDNAGNERWCGYDVYVDKTPPSIWTSQGPWSQGCGGYRGVHVVYEVSDGESGLSYVGDWWGDDPNSFDPGYAINRPVSWGSGYFAKEHNWSYGCRTVNSPGTGCYRIKVVARDTVGNESWFISPDCAYRGW